ncbi:hypothetical protein D3C71_1341220 [compost metagenome]
MKIRKIAITNRTDFVFDVRNNASKCTCKSFRVSHCSREAFVDFVHPASCPLLYGTQLIATIQGFTVQL